MSIHKNICFLVVVIFLVAGQSIFSQNAFIYTLNNLDFGDVYIGYPKTVNHTDAGAAKFRAYQDRRNNAWILINFTLPSTLNNASYTVPIAFGSTTSAWSLNDLPSGRTNFDPNSFLITRIRRNDDIFIWLGGSITVPTNCIPGIYSSTITVTMIVF
jgi:hypothetical protein